jgi:hypothetical protein
MNLRIWKYTLEITDRQTFSMPKGAKILTVQSQHGGPQLWALVDADQPKEAREIEIHGTGNPIERMPGQYIGTFQVHDGMLVFHVFEATRG